MARKVFINYRRDDGAATARSVRDRLVSEFGSRSIFMDVDSLIAGQRFGAELDAALSRCDVLLALIGPHWLEILHARAASSERDFVVEEIATALQRSIVVIPVTFDDALLPRATDLPEAIRPLVGFQKQSLSHERFGADMHELVLAIRHASGSRSLGWPSTPRGLAVAAAIAVAGISTAAYLMSDSRIGELVHSAFRSPPSRTISSTEPTRLQVSETVAQQIGNQRVNVTRRYVRLIAPLISAKPAALPAENAEVHDFDPLKLLKGVSTVSPQRPTVYEALSRAGAAQKISASTMQIVMSAHAALIDFTRPVAAADVVDLLFEVDDTRPEGPYELPLFVALSTGVAASGYYRFARADGTIEYFDAKGMRPPRVIRQKPVEGATVVLSGTFGVRRDPILGYAKVHQGVDWAAPVGTPVVAAADGVVEVAERQGGYGNLIVLRHIYSVKTAYAHLDHFADGLAPERTVRQGEVIGFIGATGLATGPHLHFEVRINDRYIDVLTLETTHNTDLSPPEREAFERDRKRIDGLLTRSTAAERSP